MLPLDDARAHVFARCFPLRPVELALSAVLGLVLAADVSALEDVPPFDNSAVDGFAVRSADVCSAGASLTIVDTVAAGAAALVPIGPGEAVRIMTGAPLPDGADAICMVEDTSVVDGHVTLAKSLKAGDAIRRSASDVRQGDLVFRAGTILGPAHIGVLSSIGCRSVLVFGSAKVGVISTGDELVEDDRPLRPGEIRESNRKMLLAMVRQAGCDAIDLGNVRDDEAALELVLRSAVTGCDAVVSSGGVSMGDFDVVKAVLSRIADMRWMQIAIKPAKPFAFGTLEGKPVFGLPGNPVSSMVSFEVLARPALRSMMGHSAATADRQVIRAVSDDGLARRPDGKLHLTRVHAAFDPDGRLHVRSGGEQGSHQLAATALANAIAYVADGTGVAAGDEVDVMLLA